MDTPRTTVAVVDDDESVLKALSRLLRSAGMDALAFSSGEGLLENLPDVRPDCLLVDICMPGMDGGELLQRLNAIGCNVPAIVITAHDDEHARETFRSAGAAALLLKPLDDRVLLQAIRTAIG